MTWAVGDGPPVDQAIKVLYESRVTATDLTLLRNVPTCPADLAADLPRIYFYVIPLALAEGYHALGDYADAETQYVQAARYQYLNTTVEAPYLWARLATLYLDWGDSLFRQGDAGDAMPIYSRVINPDDTKPASVLYTTASLQPGAAIAEQVLAALADITTLNLDPDIVSVIAAVRGQLAKISGGLDFWGFWTATVPIWTFDYLQGVAVNFAQLAVSVERDVINFWDRADQATLTRQQLATSASAASAEVSAAQAQVSAAQAQQVAYQDGAALAAQRAADATANADEYATESDLAISYQASSAQISGGDDGDPNTLNQLADQLLSGQGFSGSQATVAAATQLAGAKANRQYEVDSLKRQAAELATARAQANAEAAAAGAGAQTAAAQAAYAVASIRAQGAAQLLSAFGNQTFTADVWQRMGDVLYRLYQRYLSMALYARTASGYRPQVDAGAWRVQADGDGFTCQDRDGNRYTLGTTAARLADPADSMRVFGWHLEQVADALGHTAAFTWGDRRRPALSGRGQLRRLRAGVQLRTAPRRAALRAARLPGEHRAALPSDRAAAARRRATGAAQLGSALHPAPVQPWFAADQRGPDRARRGRKPAHRAAADAWLFGARRTVADPVHRAGPGPAGLRRPRCPCRPGRLDRGRAARPARAQPIRAGPAVAEPGRLPVGAAPRRGAGPGAGPVRRGGLGRH
jgi:hypothetical protein